MAEEHPIISDINTHFQEVVLTKNNLNWRLKERLQLQQPIPFLTPWLQGLWRYSSDVLFHKAFLCEG